jgi:hypothetical protein
MTEGVVFICVALDNDLLFQMVRSLIFSIKAGMWIEGSWYLYGT